MIFFDTFKNYISPSRNSTYSKLFADMDRRLNALGLDFTKTTHKMRAVFQILLLSFGYTLCLKGIISTKIQDKKFVSYFVGAALSINIVPKFFHLYFYHKEFNNLKKVVIRNTDEFYVNQTHQTNFERDLLKKYNRKTSLIAYIFILTFTTQCIFCCLGPFLIEENEMPLPVYLEIPGLSNREHPGYEISFFFCVYHVFYSMNIVFGLDLSFYVIVMYIAYRLDLCQHMILGIGDESAEYSADSKQQQLIRDCIILHMDVTEFALKFKNSFSMMIFFQIAATLLLMTTTMTSLENNFALSFSVFVAYSFQFLLYCIFGELVVYKFNETSEKLYCSHWYNLRNIKHRKLILFFLLQTTRKFSISTYDLFELSLDTFAVVLKAAYGYFTVLQNVM